VIGGARASWEVRSEESGARVCAQEVRSGVPRLTGREGREVVSDWVN